VGSPRWRKLRGDLRAMRGRVALMVLALAVSLTGFGTVLGARTVLRRQISPRYLSTHPADATLELAGDVDPQLLAAVRARPGIAEADARHVLMARVRPAMPPAPAVHHALAHAMEHLGLSDADPDPDPRPWRPLQLFVVDDFHTLRLNTFRSESGAWPPPDRTMLIERTAVRMIGAGERQTVTVQTPHGAPQSIAISGIVHDPGLAPAWQEGKGYGYITRATLAALGEPPELHELRVTFDPPPPTGAEVEAAASSLASWLAATGHAVHQIRVPGLRAHPHASQMATAQVVMLVFSLLLLVLCAILIATLLSAMLARQVREIGVMKAIGARTAQLARLYAAAVALLGLAACVIAVPAAALGARALLTAIAGMMNLDLADPAIPPWVFAVQAATGVVVPLAIAIVPIQRACRLTVRDALVHHGTRSDHRRPSRVALPLAARNAIRRPARLALTLALLTTGGVLSITAYNLKRAYEANIARMPEMWHYDIDIRLTEPQPIALAARLAAVPGVRAAEAWGFGAAARAQHGPIDVVHTYPDQGHGSFPVWGAPPGSSLVDLPVISGRWLVPEDRDAIVVGKTTGCRVGDSVELSFDGARSTWTVVGVVDSIPPAGGYVSAAAFAQATHTEGTARVLRIAATAGARGDLNALVDRIERELADQGVAIDGTTTFGMIRGAMDAHVLILVRAALLLSALIAVIGLVGLGAAASIGIIERTREIGVMKTIGATDARVFRLVLGEAMLVGLASWIASSALSLPLTAVLDRYVSSLGFLAARFVVSPGAMLGWLAVVVAGSATATLAPARRAARLTVRDALAET
jgi:putative ABC transport system permease protein